MRIKAIINRKSRIGNRREVEAVLRDRLGDSLVGIQETEYPRHATQIAEQAVMDVLDAIVVIGGDGTVNEVVNGLVGSDVAIAIIPSGTANDLASFYRLPSDPVSTCRFLLRPQTHYLDVIEVNGWHYVTGGGFGFPCEVARVANAMKAGNGVGRFVGRLLGSRIYMFALLIALLKSGTESNPVVIQCDGRVINGDFLWLMVDNQPFIGKSFVLSPGAVNDDGLFDLCMVENHKSRGEIMSLAQKVRAGAHVGLPSVRIGRSRELIVRFEKPVIFFGDGETIPESKEFRLSVIPRSLRLVVGEVGDVTDCTKHWVSMRGPNS